MPDLVTRRPEGLYCEPGDFYIDPWLPVDRAVITHAHADHCRPGHAAYLAQRDALGLMRARLGDEAPLEGLAYGETRRLGDVTLSLRDQRILVAESLILAATRATHPREGNPLELFCSGIHAAVLQQRLRTVVHTPERFQGKAGRLHGTLGGA